MENWRRIVGTNVRRLRTERGLTQEHLAGDAKIDVTYLRGIEAGRYNPSLMIMVRVAKALSVRPGELLRQN
jgi:transcriptional regulator with XRE-family HTH domain